ncbi:hypothetical protein PHIM19_220 [Sinorhizobium phage phiM19]|nr:hypothetical protein PHIM19_220 [Sinorhizobium phage phiM19]
MMKPSTRHARCQKSTRPRLSRHSRMIDVIIDVISELPWQVLLILLVIALFIYIAILLI